MPERETIERARKDAREGKSPSTQAGEFVREEVHQIREESTVRAPRSIRARSAAARKAARTRARSR